MKTSGRPQRPGFETSAVFPLTGTDKRPHETLCSSRSIPRHQTESRRNTRSADLSKKEMRAALFYGKEDIRFEEVPEPVVDEGKVLVEVEWCGICGTDLHLYHLGNKDRIVVMESCTEQDTLQGPRSLGTSPSMAMSCRVRSGTSSVAVSSRRRQHRHSSTATVS